MAHVLFMDIVAYSRMPMDQQEESLRHLQDKVRGTSEFTRAQASNQLIRLPTGDGMALVFFDDPEAPVRCAFELGRALRQEASFQLRMGIHTGPVYRVADINANRNVAGGGINIAQRVMDCGDAGHILGSGTVAEVLSQVSTWNTTLHDLGEVEVKHGLRIHVYNLYTDEVGNKETPKKISAPGIPVLPPAVPPVPQVQPPAVSLPGVASGGSTKRGLYMGLGALVVVGVLFAAGFYLPRRLKIHAGEGKAAFPAKPAAAAPASSQSAAPAASSTAGAVVAAPGSAGAQSNQTAAPDKTGQPAGDTSSGAPPARADSAGNIKHNSQGTPASAEQRRATAERAQAQAEADAAEAARAKAAAEDLKEAEVQEDQLNGRATSVSQSLDNLKSRQSAQGYGLRGDVVSAEQRMQSYMSKAQAALERQDGPNAKKFFEQAEREITFLEKFLGH
jgi:class 3 adenylate cyclase